MKSDFPIKPPATLPSLEAVCRLINQRVNPSIERSILAFYERNEALLNHVRPLADEERQYVRKLAFKYKSHLAGRI